MILLPEIVGPLLLVPVLIGLVGMVRAPRLRLLAALVLFTFAAHSGMRGLGMFGSAGYARYFSAFAPCLAVAGCLGWNRLVPWLSDRVGTRRVSWVWRGVVVVSFVFNLCYVDAQFWNRDAWAVRVYMKPLAVWIWLGALVMAIGGLISLTDRRYRVGAAARRRGPA